MLKKIEAIEFANYLRETASPLAPNKSEWRLNGSGKIVRIENLYEDFINGSKNPQKKEKEN